MSDRAALLELIRRYVDEALSEAEFQQLQDQLRGDSESRRLFRDYLELDAAIESWSDGVQMEAPDHEAMIASSSSRSSSARYPASMKRAFRVLSTLACGVCLIFFAIWVASDHSPVWATVSEVTQGVMIEGNGESRRAQPGDQLRASESIAVTEDASARITVMGLGSATLGPQTRLQRSGNGRSIELANGFARITPDQQKASRPWRIRTPQAEATVTTTEFNIASAEGRTALRVSEGSVHLTSRRSGAAEDVGAGRLAVVESNSPIVVAPCRRGSALIIVSPKPPHAIWNEFNQIISERLLNARLWQMGFRVDVKTFDDVQKSDLEDRAIVIVSLFDDGVGEPAIDRIELAKADIPVICLEPEGFPHLGMTLPLEGVGFGFGRGGSTVEFADIGHPIAAGQPNPGNDLLRATTGWGRPEGEGTLIAHLAGQPQHAVLFVYDRNQLMADLRAPARRVALFLDPYRVDKPRPEEWRLLEEAVKWCVAEEQP